MEETITLSFTVPAWAIIACVLIACVTVPLQLWTAVLALKITRLKIKHSELFPKDI